MFSGFDVEVEGDEHLEMGGLEGTGSSLRVLGELEF